MVTPILFYALAFLIIFFALGVLLSPNPIFSSLYLAGTMITLSAVYYMLQVPFIAAVQLIVYAGAVMILFVMVLMMFDLKNEKQIFAKGFFSNLLKLGSAGFFTFTLFSMIFHSSSGRYCNSKSDWVWLSSQYKCTFIYIIFCTICVKET